MTATGGCLCGAVSYRTTAPLRAVVACHCTQCRKTSGNYVAATAAPRADLHITGAPVWYQSSPEARRGFCGVCGSNLFWDGGGERISIFAGTLDGAPDLPVAGHIFCASRGRYYTIDENARQFEGPWT